MKKKRYLLLSVIAFLLTITSVSARQLTLKELINRVDTDKVDTIYIIGDHAFTSKHKLTTQDVMLAARTIKNVNGETGHYYDASKYQEDSIYKAMTLHKITINFDTSTFKVNGATVSNIFGSTNLDLAYENDSKKYNINYIDYEYISEDTEIKYDLELSSYTEKLKELNYNGNDSTLKLNDGKLTGLIEYNPKVNDKFNSDKANDYYFAYLLKIKDANENTTIKMTSGHGITRTITGTDGYDKNSCTGDYCEVVILVAIGPNDATKKVEVTVDRDGDNNHTYGPTTYTIDYSGVTFQTVSTGITETVSSPHKDDQDTFKTWGYNSSVNKDMRLTEGNLTGTVVEQTLTQDNVFGASNKTGFFFDFKFVIPNGFTKDKVKIQQLAKAHVDGVEDEVKKEFKEAEFDDDNNLTILIKFENTNCKNGEADKCKLYFKIDLDGDGKNYLPTYYTIDYKDVTFEKSSKFIVDAVNSSNEDNFTDGSFLNANGYKVEVKQDDTDPTKYNVTGFLPMFNDNDWEDHKSPFDDVEALYYLGLYLKLDHSITTLETSDKIKFLHGDAEDDSFLKNIKLGDLGVTNDIYLLKYVDPNEKNKEFTITVDLDGDGNEYAPYTVTINWEGLNFQKESPKEQYKPESVSDVTKLKQKDQNELTSYGFDNSLDAVTLDNQTVAHMTLTGNVKEQTLLDASGFQTKEGYYVPIKVPIPLSHPNYNQYKDKWTITLYDEDGNTKVIKPSAEDKESGYIMVLFKIYRNGNTHDGSKKEIKYTVDIDGDGVEYSPVEYVIDYSSLTFQSENELKFTYLNESGETTEITKKIYEGEVIPETIKNEVAKEVKNNKYHTFDYWYETDANTAYNFGDDSTKTTENQDITLKAHWTLNVDAFVADVVSYLNNPDSEISSDFSDIFKITKDDTTITIESLDTLSKLSKMDETTIPGALAYILDKGEIKDITLTYDTHSVKFDKDYSYSAIALGVAASNLKAQIKQGAAKVFTDAGLSADTTLNSMALKEDSKDHYTLTIGDTLDESVKLADSSKKTYTIKFTTNSIGVNNQTELEQALSKGIKNIQILKSFDVNTNLTINKPTTIFAAKESGYAITANTTDTIFTVANSNVKMNNLKLKNANQTAIIVTSGSTLTFSDIDLSGSKEAGIEVKSNGTISGDKLTMTNETYDIPAVRISKDATSTNIRLTDSTNHIAGKVEKKKILESNGKDDGPSGSKTSDKIDEDSTYSYYNYYTNPEHGKIYKVEFQNLEARKMGQFLRYVKSGEQVKLPPSEDGAEFHDYQRIDYNGHIYELKGYSLNSNDTRTADGEGNTCSMPESVKTEITVTSDMKLYTAYCVKVKEGAVHVNSTDQFKNAIRDGKTEIYIDNVEIDYGDEPLVISNNLAIYGDKKEQSILKAKYITITADDVFFQRLTIQGTSTDYSANNDAIINMNNSHDYAEFSLWDAILSNEGTGIAKYGINVTNSTKVIGDIRWNRFSGKNINNFVYLNGPVATGTDIYLDTFGKDDAQASSKNSDVIIKGFASDSANIRIASNTYSNNAYNVRLESASGQTAEISTDKGKFGIDYTDSAKNFSNIKIVTTGDTDQVSIKYLKDSAETEPFDGQQVAVSKKEN